MNAPYPAATVPKSGAEAFRAGLPLNANPFDLDRQALSHAAWYAGWRNASRAATTHTLQRQCDDFNARYRVGQRVVVRKDGGDGVETVTRSKAEVLSGHSAVIWLEGIAGCYLLDRVTPVTGGAA